MYQRKTKDVWKIMTNYGTGWETESEYDNEKEAITDMKEYKLAVSHYGGEVKLIKTRERLV